MIAVESTADEYYIVFHAEGYTVYEPNHCHIVHVVSRDFALVGQGSVLCPTNKSCEWGEAAHVGNKFVYVAQPNLNRVVVIELSDRFNPIEVRSIDNTDNTQYSTLSTIYSILYSTVNIQPYRGQYTDTQYIHKQNITFFSGNS